VLVDGDSYLLELVRYIHLNPVRSGMVANPEDYPWSGHRAYLGKEFLPWLTTEWVLGQFGKSVVKARAAYREFVFEGLGEEHRPEFHGGKEDSRLLGDDNFMDKCLARHGDKRLYLTMRAIVDTVCKAYNLDQFTLRNPSQQRSVSEARAVVGWLARELCCGTLSEVGKSVNRDVGSVSSAVRRLSYRMEEDMELKERILSIKTHLETA